MPRCSLHHLVGLPALHLARNGVISHPCLVLSSITLLQIHESTYTTCQTLGGSRGVSESSLSPQRWPLLWSWSWISCVPVCFAIGKKEASSSDLTESPGMKWNTASWIFLRYPRCNSMVHILSQLLFSWIAILFRGIHPAGLDDSFMVWQLNNNSTQIERSTTIQRTYRLGHGTLLKGQSMYWQENVESVAEALPTFSGSVHKPCAW